MFYAPAKSMGDNHPSIYAMTSPRKTPLPQATRTTLVFGPCPADSPVSISRPPCATPSGACSKITNRVPCGSRELHTPRRTSRITTARAHLPTARIAATGDRRRILRRPGSVSLSKNRLTPSTEIETHGSRVASAIPAFGRGPRHGFAQPQSG